MFDDSKLQLDRAWSLLSSKKGLIIYAVLIVVCLLTIVALLIANGTLGGSSVNIPKNVTKNIKSTIYLPSRLPGNYKIDDRSFTTAEGGNVLIFNATDGVGAQLIFSEQPKPKNFNFEDFYQTRLRNVKTLSDVRYPSVWGKSLDGRVALSIVADDTWIFMVTSAPLDKEDMARIAASIDKH